jgi:hypothetical protein
VYLRRTVDGEVERSMLENFKPGEETGSMYFIACALGGTTLVSDE